MLSRSTKTKYPATVESPDSIYPKQDLETESTPSTAFPSIKDEDGNREDDEHSGDGNHQHSEREENIFQQLLPQTDFREMLDSFFVVEQKKLIILRSRFRQGRNIDSRSLFFLRKCGTQSIEEFRICYYKGQMILYKTPIGQEFDLLL